MPRKKVEKVEIHIKCSACVYFKDFNADDANAKIKAGMGECRRYPPLVGTDDDGDSFYYWSGVGGDEWCGEFRQRCNS